MRKRSLLIAMAWVASGLYSPSASRAEMVAGWDFSQYFGDGLLSIDGATFGNTLAANYSDFDPTFGAGAEAAAFGTLYFDGSFGSSSTPTDGTGPFVPSASAPGSLTSNLDAPGGVPFDSSTVLLNEGQIFFNELAMLATAGVNVVFEADLSSVPDTGSNWSVSFAGKTFSGTSMVGVEFSSDGSAYTDLGSVELTTTDTLFTVDLDAAISETGYVRLSFSPSGLDQPFIDNVAIHVPEASVTAQAVAAMLGLFACFGWRRISPLR